MPYTHMELAEAFLKTGELEDALEAVNQQLNDHADDDTARRLLIQIQMRLLSPERQADLLAEFERIKEPVAEDWQMKSVILERRGKLTDAIDAMNSAQGLDPTNERLSERRLDLLVANEDYQQALSLVRQQNQTWRWLEREGDVLVLMGDDMLATARYGLVLVQLDAFEGKMNEDYLSALKARVMLARAHAYRRLGHTETARDHYLDALGIIGEDVTIRFNLGLIEELEGNSTKAKELCQSALDQASPTLRQTMRDSLDVDEQFNKLKQVLDA